MKNFSIVSTDQNAARTELHDRLGLTGAEVSINTIPAGGSVPFVHWHRKNEEIYGILSGSGRFEVDGESVPLKAGDWIRIAPAGKRRIFASADSAISFVCIQVKAGSLEEFTAGDAEA